MNKDSKYEPVEGDSFEKLLDKALACGRDLHPRSLRATWIDSYGTPEERRQLVNAYHEGQSEQYTDGNW